MASLETDSGDLVRDASRGDRAALEELLQQQLPGLRAYVRLRCGETVRLKESCSDLVQSVCREVLADLGGFEYRGEAAFRQWLYQAAERKIIDRARYWQAEKRDLSRERRAPEAAGAAGAPEAQLIDSYRSFYTPSHAAIAREELARVERAFDRLPEHYRKVITLSRLVGLPHAEIARQMGKTEGAVRTLLCRALAELSEEIEG